MLAAAGILFYVSYWLISQIEAKRWIDFLRKQARQGLELGGRGNARRHRVPCRLS